MHPRPQLTKFFAFKNRTHACTHIALVPSCSALEICYHKSTPPPMYKAMVPTGTDGEISKKTSTHHKMKAEPIHLALEPEDLGIMPWCNYIVQMPIKPLPPVSQRPHIPTKRLLVRPITLDDLDQFHELRRRPETQNHCACIPPLPSPEVHPRHYKYFVTRNTCAREILLIMNTQQPQEAAPTATSKKPANT